MKNVLRLTFGFLMVFQFSTKTEARSLEDPKHENLGDLIPFYYCSTQNYKIIISHYSKSYWNGKIELFGRGGERRKAYNRTYYLSYAADAYGITFDGQSSKPETPIRIYSGTYEFVNGVEGPCQSREEISVYIDRTHPNSARVVIPETWGEGIRQETRIQWNHDPKYLMRWSPEDREPVYNLHMNVTDSCPIVPEFYPIETTCNDSAVGCIYIGPKDFKEPPHPRLGFDQDGGKIQEMEGSYPGHPREVDCGKHHRYVKDAKGKWNPETPVRYLEPLGE